MLGIGKVFPEFELKAVRSSEPSDSFETINQDSFPGKWKAYFFWPKDFTFVCPTEISGFSDLYEDFLDRDCEVIGCSTDNEFVHAAWRRTREDLANCKFAWLSDIKRELVTELGILDEDEGVAQRATYLVDPDNVIRFVCLTDFSVGRNIKEVLRVLDALQTDELCPCNWEKGQQTLGG